MTRPNIYGLLDTVKNGINAKRKKSTHFIPRGEVEINRNAGSDPVVFVQSGGYTQDTVRSYRHTLIFEVFSPTTAQNSVRRLYEAVDAVQEYVQTSLGGILADNSNLTSEYTLMSDFPEPNSMAELPDGSGVNVSLSVVVVEELTD